MTREDAIKELSVEYFGDSEKIRKAKKMAIKALSVEPCEDCISRADAIANIRILYPDMPVVDIMGARHKWSEKYQQYRDCEKILADLPSVQPKPKTGHWISKHIVDDCNGVVTWYECSECGRSIDAPITEEFMLKDYPYCHCGAKMIPTDSESGG